MDKSQRVRFNGDDYFHDPDYPSPPPELLTDHMFNAIWKAIKDWDISRYPEEKQGGHRMYAGANGSDVMHILNAILPKKPNE